VIRTGIALQRAPKGVQSSVALLCGLAGGLTSALEPGTILVPEAVGLPDGRTIRCHEGWVQALVQAAGELALKPETGPLLTAPSLVTGDERARWALQGYVAADMETGLLASDGWAVATVRVILDTPSRSIGEDWERPMSALLRPRLWRELFWLARTAPQYSLRAASVLRHALVRCNCR